MLTENIDAKAIKTRSEKIILNFGGEVLDWLPTIEYTEARTKTDVINRALIMNALYQIHIGAPKPYINNWINKNGLTSYLTSRELAILTSERELADEEHFELHLSLEALWAISWATNLIDTLPFDQEVGSELASLSPNLQLNEDGFKYTNNMNLRSKKTIYEMLDLYYRLHWWVNNALIAGKSTGDISFGVIRERRKALEWILNKNTTWDNIDLSL
ncbi:MAG: DUF4272 domain-containing protein [Legionellaceae bacterium]|nr:DUF4272 domain-containing protein [Legionellaceae bacterium]